MSLVKINQRTFTIPNQITSFAIPNQITSRGWYIMRLFDLIGLLGLELNTIENVNFMSIIFVLILKWMMIRLLGLELNTIENVNFMSIIFVLILKWMMILTLFSFRFLSYLFTVNIFRFINII